MNSEAIFKLLNTIEDQVPISKFKVQDMDLWPLIRFQFVLKLNSMVLGNNPETQSYQSRVREKIKLIPTAVLGFMKQISLDVKTKSDLTPRDILCLTDTSSKRMKVSGKWYDTFIDPILDHYESLGKSYLVLETSQRFLFRSPSLRESRSLMWMMVQKYAGSLSSARSVSFSSDFLHAYAEYESLLEENGAREGQVSLEELKFEVAYLFQLVLAFEEIIQKVSPKLVLMVPYNGYSGRALTYVCNKHNILTCDIQHGVQGYYHPAYAQFRNAPLEGFNTMPRVFLTWSRRDKAVIDEWASDGFRFEALTLGNLFEDTFRTDNARSLAFDKLFKEAYKKQRGKYFILISLVWDQYLPDEFKSLIGRNKDDYFFLIRFHPSTTSRERKIVIQDLNEMKVSNWEVAMATELPLYALLRNVDLNVTQRSSTVLEAANFGVISFVSDPIGLSYYSELLKSGTVIRYRSVKDVDNFFSARRKVINKPGVTNTSAHHTILNKVLGKAMKGL